jgi:hypothetical protein
MHPRRCPPPHSVDAQYHRTTCPLEEIGLAIKDAGVVAAVFPTGWRHHSHDAGVHRPAKPQQREGLLLAVSTGK